MRDLRRVIDQVRAAMPAECPNDKDGLLHAYTAPTDLYRGDGRALQHLRYSTHPRRLWFSTAARFAATIDLPVPIPPTTLGRFIRA